jgi:hypothetical protein
MKIQEFWIPDRQNPGPFNGYGFFGTQLPKFILFVSLSSDNDLKTLSTKRDLYRRQVKTVQN